MLTSKLKSKIGETISETLIALLISSFAMLMLATAVMTASGVVTKSRQHMDAYYSENESETGIIKKGSGGEYSVASVSAVDSPDCTVYDDFSIDILCYENNELNRNIPVISYQKNE